MLLYKSTNLWYIIKIIKININSIFLWGQGCWVLMRWKKPLPKATSIWSPWENLWFKNCAVAILIQTQNVFHFDWRMNWKVFTMKLWWIYTYALVRDFSFSVYSLNALYVRFSSSKNCGGSLFFIFKDLWWKFFQDFRACSPWNFNGLESLEFLETLELDSALTIEILGGFGAWFQQVETFECPPKRLIRVSIYSNFEEV